MELSLEVKAAFNSFQNDSSLFALPMAFSSVELKPQTPVSFPEIPDYTFQQALNQLDGLLSPKTALFLIVRREGSLVAVTFVPYLANAELKALLLENRDAIFQALGKEQISMSIICKEIGEITDTRSWEERDGNGHSWGDDHCKDSNCEECGPNETKENSVKDLGYKKNKCRLCDRRMTNKIEDNALQALSKLTKDGDCVQISVDVRTEVLQLNFDLKNLSPSQVSQRLPTNSPSYTFFRHPANHVLYFIFCSPDSATVQERMKHTMAIPGLVNIIMKDNGVHVDQKIEIHDPEDLDFAEQDERIGKFRSMYLRNNFLGTESTWEGMEEDQKILDSVK